MKRLYGSLFGRVVIAAAIGVFLGVFFPGFAEALRPLSELFLKLIRMIISPLVFCVVISGMARSHDLKTVGRVGAKAIIYFELVTGLALLIGLALGEIFQPGAGMNVDVNTLSNSSINGYMANARNMSGFSEYVLGLVPETLLSALVKGEIMPVLLVSLLVGAALTKMGEEGRSVTDFIEKGSRILFQVMRFVILLAPLAVLGAIGFATAKYGVSSLRQLGFLVVIVYASCLVFVVGILGSILAACGLNVFKFLRYFRAEIMIVAATTASDAVLPALMRKLEVLGVHKSNVGLVMSSGYSFNLDGQAIYLTLAVLFIAQATNTPLSWHDLIMILLVALVTSKGVHAVPGSALVVLAATLTAIPAIPPLALVLVLPVDWIIGMARGVTNSIGNCIATVVVSVWEKDLNVAYARKVLDGNAPLPDVVGEPNEVGASHAAS
jgi:aerobic C4-dicarboxylate transport protein